MINFKEIAEKCLVGELSGTFVIDKGKNWHSSYLRRHYVIGRQMPGQYVLGPGIIYNEIGQCENRDKTRIIDFIPDNMQKQVKIDIPEGKVPVMEQTEKGIVITWKEKELTYEDIKEKLSNDKTYIGNFGYNTMSPNLDTQDFYQKVGVFHKLVNIRNYFGKPDSHNRGYCISYDSYNNKFYVGNINTIGVWTKDIVFSEKEHVEQAIKMLGDELKYLFEPW